MKIKPVIEKTGDGSDTLRHPVTGEAYHSLRGALGESKHVFIANGLEAAVAGKTHASILEAGFGSGLNAWLTLDFVRGNSLTVDYLGIDLYPVEADVAAGLNYTDDPAFMNMHRAPWETATVITPGFSLTKTEADLASYAFEGIFDLVYFDAFAPDAQPGLWSAEVFSRIYLAMAEGGVLVTYSAKGSVKQALRAAGFEVSRLPGALGKRHMLRAVKKQPEKT